MMHTHFRALLAVTIRVGLLLALGAVLVLAAGVAAPARGQEFPPEDLEHFESRIRPVLAERCYLCHGADPERIFGGLVLVDAAGVRAGGDSGAVVVPGSPDDSRLIDVIRYDGPIRMPPDGRLPAGVVADFERWVTRGAVDPRVSDTPVVAARSDSGATYDFGPGREHWAYRPMARPEPPAVDDPAWARSAIDRFVLARLETEGLTPVAPAGKRQLLRRVTFDLTGLPPTPAEMDAFLADERPDVYERVVERLLASPRYGERWGRHWLDVARYADSNGLDENIAHPNAFRYRDWVIDAFNADKPYDRFVQEQIAGDLLPAAGDAERFSRTSPGTGFLTLGAKVLAEQDVDKMVIDIVDEQVNVIGRVIPGRAYRVRPLPRPQVRPDSHRRLLRAGRHPALDHDDGRREPRRPVGRAAALRRRDRRSLRGGAGAGRGGAGGGRRSRGCAERGCCGGRGGRRWPPISWPPRKPIRPGATTRRASAGGPRRSPGSQAAKVSRRL